MVASEAQAAGHSVAMICGTYRMMLRVWRHRPTAIRFTSQDLGLPTIVVVTALELAREPLGAAPLAPPPPATGATRSRGAAGDAPAPRPHAPH